MGHGCHGNTCLHVYHLCVNVHATFPRLDAAATNYFIVRFSVATIRGRPLIEDIYWIEQFTGYTAMHSNSSNPFEITVHTSTLSKSHHVTMPAVFFWGGGRNIDLRAASVRL